MTELAFDLARLHAAYADGFAPTAVVEAVFDRIAAADDPGVFITLADRGKVLAEAEALGPFDPLAKPLYGVPFAVKDNIDVAGLPTTAACPEFAYLPTEDATVVARLKAAGALVIGKTNLDQFATGLVGVRTPYPVPRNAVDPDLVPGGSSSGSAVAVARGLVTFALGTDTAGSGRVPAALNAIVGLKPSVGALSTAGVLPACRSLDCVSIFAGTVEDAHRVLGVAAAADPADPFSRRVPVGPAVAPPVLKIGVPSPETIRFHGDSGSQAAFAESVADLSALGATVVPVDMTPFYEAALLLYEGAWVAERYAAIESFIRERADSLHPVTRQITLGALKHSAVDTFKGFYRLAALRRACEAAMAGLDALMVPSIPGPVTLSDIAAEPIAANSRLGTYTNFVNLLDLAALAVPGRPRASDGRPSGVTLVGRSGADGLLAGLGSRLHRRAATTIGATGWALPAEEAARPAAPDGWIAVAVVGAHLSGMPLNKDLTGLGGVFLFAGETAPVYQFHALAGGPPFRPGLQRVESGGASIALEVWAMPPAGFGQFVAGIPAPLGIGTVLLADGSRVKGFICENAGLEGATDITRHGGWRAYMAARTAAE